MEHVKSNEMERQKYNAGPPTGERLRGLWRPFFFSGVDEELRRPTRSTKTKGRIDYMVIRCPPY